jgi:hypothetical protein
MVTEFKPVSFFVIVAMAALVVRGVSSFYTHRATAKEGVGE